jgi:hypothetical protein
MRWVTFASALGVYVLAVFLAAVTWEVCVNSQGLRLTGARRWATGLRYCQRALFVFAAVGVSAFTLVTRDLAAAAMAAATWFAVSFTLRVAAGLLEQRR